MAKLTQARIDATKPKALAGPKKLFDTDGLYLLVKPSGARGWRLKYRHGGKEKLISLGPYPEITLKRAREKCAEMRALIADGKDPSAEREAEKRAERIAQGNTFAAVAAEWLAEQTLADNTRERNARVLKYLNAHIGEKPMREIDAPTLVAALRSIRDANGPEAAGRARVYASAVFQHAINDGRAAVNPAAGLSKLFQRARVRHRAALFDPKAVGALLRRIESYQGQPVTVAALKLLALTFVRPGELRQAQWKEIDLDEGQWVIPVERMKMRNHEDATDHVVPLAEQAIAILRELQTITDRGPNSFVFPSLRPGRPLSENTFNQALRAMDYDTETQHCAHGFRRTASTLLHERGFEPDVIECQLAHTRPGVGASTTARTGSPIAGA